MEEAAAAQPDPWFRQATRDWARRIDRGASLADVLRQAAFVPSAIVWHVSVTEGTAALPDALERGGMQALERAREKTVPLTRIAAILLHLLVAYGAGMVFSSFFLAIIRLQHAFIAFAR